MVVWIWHRQNYFNFVFLRKPQNSVCCDHLLTNPKAIFFSVAKQNREKKKNALKRTPLTKREPKKKKKKKSISKSKSLLLHFVASCNGSETNCESSARSMVPNSLVRHARDRPHHHRLFLHLWSNFFPAKPQSCQGVVDRSSGICILGFRLVVFATL